MASGNTLLTLGVGDEQTPASSYAGIEQIAGASTPAEQFLVFAFDSSSVEYMDFKCVMPRHYGGGGVTVTFISSTSTTAGGTDGYVLSAAFRRVQDDAEDLDTTAQTYDYNNTAEIQPPSVKGEVTYDTVTFTNTGSDMDDVAAGEMFIFRIRRLTSDANDTLTEDIYVHSIEIKET